MKTVETQTDNASASALLSSVTISREEPDCARVEIAKLREARDPLNGERKTFAERLKAVKIATGSSQAVLEEERQLYEMEEAIEAIDMAIEFKNELICGHESILSDNNAPGQEKAELVTRLASLSVFDLQRLFCKFFVKVVELRFCTRSLEKKVDKLEDEREVMKRRMNIDKKAIQDMESAHAKRIKDLLTIGNGDKQTNAVIKQLEKDLAKAERKQLDYRRSLTELLVRQGLLLNGADYDVRQVVKMLGLDPEDLHGWRSGTGPNQAISRELASSHHPQGPKRSINQRRNAEILGVDRTSTQMLPSTSRKSHHPRHENNSSHRQHAPQASSLRHHAGGGHLSSNTHYAQVENHRERERERQPHHGNSRHHNSHQEDNYHHGTEVKRTKNKLIIQPSHEDGRL